MDPIAVSGSHNRTTRWRTVAAIAYRAFESFRLRVDPQIPEARARHSRREWVRNGFKGRAEAIYVAETEKPSCRVRAAPVKKRIQERWGKLS